MITIKRKIYPDEKIWKKAQLWGFNKKDPDGVYEFKNVINISLEDDNNNSYDFNYISIGISPNKKYNYGYSLWDKCCGCAIGMSVMKTQYFKTEQEAIIAALREIEQRLNEYIKQHTDDYKIAKINNTDMGYKSYINNDKKLLDNVYKLIDKYSQLELFK